MECTKMEVSGDQDCNAVSPCASDVRRPKAPTLLSVRRWRRNCYASPKLSQLGYNITLSKLRRVVLQRTAAINALVDVEVHS